MNTNPRHCEGVGTAVKEILSSMGIHAQSGCSCDSLIVQWNESGVQWCERNVDVMVDQLLNNSRQLQGVNALTSAIALATRSTIGQWTIRKAARLVIARAIDHVKKRNGEGTGR